MNRKQMLVGAAVFLVSALMFALASYNAGALPTLAYGLWLMFDARPRKGDMRVPHQFFTRLFSGFIAAYLLWQGVCVALVLHAQAEPPARKPDAIVVLGAGFFGDTVSTVLEERLEAALAMARRYPQALLVLSGGRGFGERKTEAELMRAWLTDRGIAAERLLLEDQALDTVQNFRNSKALLDTHFGAGTYSAAFITSEFHLYRSRNIAARQGFSTVCVATDTWWFLLPPYLVRETFAILHDQLFPA